MKYGLKKTICMIVKTGKEKKLTDEEKSTFSV